MKKLVVLLIVCAFTVFDAHAVLKEKDLAQTLGVLRGELEQTYNETTALYERFERRNKEQHASLVQMMQRSNQIALMLYSQKSDFTFDMTYACQAATEQYHKLSARHLPYSKMRDNLQSEIDRYEQLIKALQNLPPRLKPNGELMQVPDSIKALLPKMVIDTSKMSLFFLDEEGMKDREECLKYATAIRDTYSQMLEVITKDQEHYEHVSKRVKELNDYAMSRYEKIQQNIFVNRGYNYFETLKRFKMHYRLAKKDVGDKYKPLKEASEWRGPVIFGISIFMLFYIVLASLLSYAIVRWILPRRVREKLKEKRKRSILMLACGVGLFAISIMVASLFVKQNFILMAINLMITFAWLLEAILVSLLIRLKDNQIIPGMRTYTPFLIMALVVIVFRIILIPNNLVNLIYPPLLLVFTIWQGIVLKRKVGRLPDSDVIYTIISFVAMIVATVAAWVGFVLLAVQIMVWWTIQLAVIQTITCFYDLASTYESRRLVMKIAREKGIDVSTQEEFDKIRKKMRVKMGKGEFISQTWLYDFVYQAVLPVFAVLSVPASIYSAARIFEMNSLWMKIFLYVFLDKPGVIQLSLFKICLVGALFFVFKYLNYSIRSFYRMLRLRRVKDANGPSNITLANNIIAIIVWGIYLVASLVILQVPRSGISIVMAGLATGLGFAMKDILENFVYGITLMAGRLRVGDYIECDSIQGKVESLNYQSTQIAILDGSVITFQNATLFRNNFKNLTRNHGYVMIKIPVGVAYGSNVASVREILLSSLNALPLTTQTGKSLIDPKHGFSVLFADFGDSSVDLYVVCWVLVEEKAVFIARIKEVIYNTLNDNNIEIPFPQRDVHIHQASK